MSVPSRIKAHVGTRGIRKNALARDLKSMATKRRADFDSRRERGTPRGVQVRFWSTVGILTVCLSSCSLKDPESRQQSPQHAPQHAPPGSVKQIERESNTKARSDEQSERESTAKLLFHDIELRPLENHLFVDPKQFESLSFQMKERLGVGKTLRLVSFDARTCRVLKRGKHRWSTGWSNGTTKTVSSSVEHLSLDDQKTMLDFTPYKVNRDAVIIYEALVLDLSSWGIHGRQGLVFFMHRHMLAPEESELSGYFWRVPETLICQQPPSQWTQPRAGFVFGKSDFGMVLSLGSSLKDYATAIEEWSRWPIGWPKECKYEHNDSPMMPMDWPALSPRFAFGGFTQPIESTKNNLSDLGLTCQGQVQIYHRRGVFGKTSKRGIQEDHTKKSVGLNSPLTGSTYGEQNRAPYTWGIVNTKTERTIVLGNFARMGTFPQTENKEKRDKKK